MAFGLDWACKETVARTIAAPRPMPDAGTGVGRDETETLP